MLDFKTLKKNTNKEFDHLLQEVEKLTAPAFEKKVDERYWKPTSDKAGNALAVIRFLPGPAVDGEDALPWVRYWDYGFQGPTGKWYIERSRTSLGSDQKDPCAEFNSKLWNSTDDDNSPERKQARDQKRRLHYESNIYVVDDPLAPENNGKVFLYKYGKKIHDKILKMMNPDLPSEPKINPFDLWKGANFKLKKTIQVVQMGKRKVPMPNYDESTFLTPGPLADDETMEKIWKSEYSLAEIVSPDKYKSYEELKAKLNEVLGLDEGSTHTPVAPHKDNRKLSEVIDDSIPFDVDEEDEDLRMFKQLAAD